MTLARDPNIAIEEARRQGSRGALEAASGQFDTIVSSALTQTDTTTPLTGSSSEESRTLSNSVGVTRQFRSGLTIEPQLDLLRTAGGSSGVLDEGTFTFRIRQPLLRGRGRAAVAAEELAAEREVAASGFDVRQTVSRRVLTVASQYWTTGAAERNLAVLRASEESSRELLEKTRKLIEADQVPSADLVQLEANLVFSESARIGGERQLFQARQDLGREIGLDPDEIGRLPLPSDPFPSVRPEEVPPPAAAGLFVDEALARRDDLRAARERREEIEIQRRAAENALKPQLDLILAPGYSGLDGGSDIGSFFSPLYRNVPGASTSVGLSLAWPLANHRAQGQLVQIEAVLRQSALTVDLLAKGIGADVPAALDAVARNTEQLDRARSAVRLFERTVVNEEKKLRAGSSTLLDVISQRDRLTSARQAEVSSELALALSLLDLRFITGTLLGDESEEGSIPVARLTTVPALLGERSP
jgi:outer membrane protein TolC